MNKFIRMLIYDLIGSLLLGISVVCFAVQANFAPGGVTGLAVLSNYLFRIPIGLMTILINIPIILCTFKRLGRNFFLVSMKSVIISSFFVDFVVVRFPMFTGNRYLAAVCAGVLAGIAYSIFFNEGSTTGGTDFIIVAVQRARPKLSFGLLAFFIDGTVIVLSMFVYQDYQSFFLGMIYTLVTSLALDGTTFLMKKLHLDMEPIGSLTQKDG